MSLEKVREAWNRLGTVQYGGSSLNEGWAYHEIPMLKDEGFTAHRGNTEKRIDLITAHSEIKGRTVFDIGCSVGGISLELANLGAKSYGIDYDHLAIDVAQACEDHFALGAVFTCGKIDRESFDRARGGKRFDLCIWFSQWMWVVHQEGLEAACDLLRHVSTYCDEMWFETGTKDGMAKRSMMKAGIKTQKDVLRILKRVTVYDEIIDHGAVSDGWLGRPIFQCRHRKREFKSIDRRTVAQGFQRCIEGHTAYAAVPDEKNFVLKVFKSGFENEKTRESRALNKLAETGGSHFPVLLQETDQYLKLSYCGEKLTAGNLPKSIERQTDEILAELKQADILHRDVRPENLHVKDGVVRLIDFGWSTALSNPEPPPKAVRAVLGGQYRKPDGFDDGYSLRSVLALDFGVGDPSEYRTIVPMPKPSAGGKTVTHRILLLPAGRAGDHWCRARLYEFLLYLSQYGIAGLAANYQFLKYETPAAEKGLSFFKKLWLELLPLRTMTAFLRADTLYLQDARLPEWALNWGEGLKKRIVYDLSEAAHLYLTNPQSQSNRAVVERMHRAMRAADLVLAADEELKTYAEAYAREVRLFPSPKSRTTEDRARELADALK